MTLVIFCHCGFKKATMSTTAKQHERPNAIVTSSLAVLFILHSIGSINIILQLHEISSMHTLFVFNLTMLILPFVLIHVFSVLYFSGESPMNPSLPFVTIIYCITFFNLDLENNFIHYFCLQSNNIIIIIINYIVTSILFSFFAISVPIISVVWLLKEYKNGPLFEIASIYQLLVMSMNTISPLFALSINGDILDKNGTTNVIILCLSILIIYLLISTVLFCKYTIQSNSSILAISISTEILLLFIMIFIVFLCDFDAEMELFTSIMFIIYVFLNIPGYKSYFVHQYIEWLMIYEWTNQDKDIIDQLYCYLHLLLYHQNDGYIHNDLHHEQTALIMNNNTQENNNRFHRKYSVQCFKTQYDYIELEEQSKYDHINKLLTYYDDYMDNGKGTNVKQLLYKLMGYIHKIASIICYLYPIAFMVIFADIESHQRHKSREIFVMILSMVYAVYCSIFVRQIMLECKSSLRYFNLVLNTMKIEKRMNWNRIEEGIKMMDVLEDIEVIFKYVQLDISLIILSYLFQPNV